MKARSSIDNCSVDTTRARRKASCNAGAKACSIPLRSSQPPSLVILVVPYIPQAYTQILDEVFDVHPNV